MAIPARVHYREASDATVSCATCSFYESTHCTMFDASVEPSYVCDEWAAITSDHALADAPAPSQGPAGDGMTAALSQAFGPEAEGLSTMVALYPSADEAASLAEPDGDPAERLHLTLAYLGKTTGPLDKVAAALRPVSGAHAPVLGTVGGVGVFGDNGGGHPAIALPSAPGLTELRVEATAALNQAGVDYSRDYGFHPHITIGYRADPVAPLAEHVGKPLTFRSLWVVRGDTERVELPLTGAKPLTAALPATPAPASNVHHHNRVLHAAYKRADALTDKLAAVVEPILRAAGDEAADAFLRRATDPLTAAAGWGSPAPDEIIDVDALVQTLRTKTDPVRLAVVESVMKPTLGNAGISFDATNPLTKKVLAQSGSQITSIAQTTQLNVMRAIRHAYEQGLSIPDTAKAIRAGMKDASVARSTLIARTEIVGAAAGGSLAATQIVSDATGTDYYKQWLTAPGAHYPRHEDYDGLDGQTVRLDETFQVGEDELQFPGDPDGSPEEVCNCRCTLVYTDDASELSDGAGGVDEGASGGDEEEQGGSEEGAGGGSPFYSGPEGDVPAMSKDDALAYYYTPQSFGLNAALRSGDSLTAEQEGVRRALDASFVPAKETMVLYRGLSDAKPVFGAAKPAARSIHDERGYMSVSASASYADDFASGVAFGEDRPVIVKIIVPKGTPILEMPPGEYNHDGAHEFLLPHGTKLQVNSFEGRSVTADQIENGAEVPTVNTSVVPSAAPAAGAGVESGLAPLEPDIESRTVDALSWVLRPDDPLYEAGLRYARKVAKVATGARASAPSLGGLPKHIADQIATAVREAVGTTAAPEAVAAVGPGAIYSKSLDEALANATEIRGTLQGNAGEAADHYITFLREQKENTGTDLERIEAERAAIKRELAFKSEYEGEPFWQHWERRLKARLTDLSAVERDAKAAAAPAGSLAADIAAIRARAEWIDSNTAARLAASRTKSGVDPRYYTASRDVTPEYLQEQLDAVMAAGARLEKELPVASVPDTIKLQGQRDAELAPLWAAADRARTAFEEYDRALRVKTFGRPNLGPTDRRAWNDAKNTDPEWSTHYSAYIETKVAADEKRKEWADRLTAARKQEITGRAAFTLEQRNALVDVLSQIRPMGPAEGVRPQFARSDSGTLNGDAEGNVAEAERAISQASEVYPSDWISGWHRIFAGTRERGYQTNVGGSHVIFSSVHGDGAVLPGDSVYRNVAVHELGHATETTNPRIQALEDVYYRMRTAGEENVPMSNFGSGYGPEEVTRPDEFANAYMGKRYDFSGAFEILTMGMESLFNGARYLDGDAQTRQFILGLLALV